MFETIAEQFNVTRTVLGLVFVALAYLAVITWRRFRSDEDPTIPLSLRTETGATSILVSGTHLVFAVVTFVVALTWPMAIEEPVFGFALVAVLVAHWFIETMERD